MPFVLLSYHIILFFRCYLFILCGSFQCLPDLSLLIFDIRIRRLNIRLHSVQLYAWLPWINS